MYEHKYAVTLVIASEGRGRAGDVDHGEPLGGSGMEVTLLRYNDGREASAYALSATVDHRCLGIESSSGGAFEAAGDPGERAGRGSIVPGQGQRKDDAGDGRA